MISPQQARKLKQEQRRLRYLCIIRTVAIRAIQRCLRIDDPIICLGLDRTEVQQHITRQKALRTRHLRHLELLAARLVPIDELPVELLQLVFMFAAVGPPLWLAKTRSILAQVSRRWRQATIGAPGLWPSVGFDETNRRHAYEKMLELENRHASRFHPLRLTINTDVPTVTGQDSETQTQPGEGIRDWTAISHLLTARRDDCKSLTLRGSEHDDRIANLLKDFPTGSLPSLRSLILTQDRFFGYPTGQPAWLVTLYDAAPHLMHLSIKGEYRLPQTPPLALRSLILLPSQLEPEHLHAIASLPCLRSLVISAWSMAAYPNCSVDLLLLHTLALDIQMDDTAASELISALHCPALKHLKFGHDFSRRTEWNRPIFCWQALADKRWELSTLHLGMGGDNDEWTAELRVLESVSGTLRTLVCGYGALERLMQGTFPVFQQLEELVVMDEGAHGVASAKTIYSAVRTIKRSGATQLARVRLLSRIRDEYGERKRYTSKELAAWSRLCTLVDVYTSWNGCPFLQVDGGDVSWWEGPGHSFCR
ncbi:hypothetical protein CALVIDRAFT_535216 [Calocera viscosa TUFC12733]|uniref:F-box domain-containing protein n=1 Tax=Calocera viscosa (strain TUFC12733) TaxID=1330018 RepID=A0A167PAL7_CALVF|nr:hypothetical protein CALVIDRAFT_535216 [Calocera viscosa TUFC12733]